MSSALNLGIIGLSDGNGHPYSWSAIFNGFDSHLIEECGFPAIPRYLKQQDFSEPIIKNARVTHIWTQDMALSQKIAKTCYIESVVNDPTEMIGQINGLLLARDDAENHYSLSLPFIRAGLPVYIDKHIALCVVDAIKILSTATYRGQIFAGSALRYAHEFNMELFDVHNILLIRGITPKSWEKYSIHIIDPIVAFLYSRFGYLGSFKIQGVCRQHAATMVNLLLSYSSKHLKVELVSTGMKDGTIYIEIYTKSKLFKLVFKDTFTAFKGALTEFCNSIMTKSEKISPKQIIDTIKILEVGILV